MYDLLVWIVIIGLGCIAAATILHFWEFLGFDTPDEPGVPDPSWSDRGVSND